MADIAVYSDVDFENDFEESDDDDDFMEENAAPVKKSKAKAAPKKKAAAPKKKAAAKGKKAALADKSNTGIVSVDDDDDDDFEMEDNNAKGGKKGGKTIEETYQKKSQLEHILLRPDTYIGSTERVTQPMFVYDDVTQKIVEKETTFTPGFYKIFDEIIVNAADNKQRNADMSEMHIDIKPEDNFVSVKNNGKGIPVKMHKDENCYVPTLIFGHLLTGSNFSDEEKKTTGGRNGYGAKLCNAFSKVFIVECLDSNEGLKFKQIFRNNMSVAEEPTVTKATPAERKKGDYTKISFEPDLARFQMESLDEGAVGLLSKRAYDIAGSMGNAKGKKLSVYLNGSKLPVKNFKDYLGVYDKINAPVAFEQIGDWEIGVAPSQDQNMQQISFVNSICTSKGGGHVNYICDQITAHLVKTVKKKNKGGADIKAGVIKNHLCIFVNCLVENPTFDSQTKDFCTSKKGKFGSECNVSDKFLKQVDKSAVVENIVSFVRFKQNEALKKVRGTKKIKLTGIAKLDDANNAGGAKSRDCTLIITEGDSAKTLAMSGLSVVGRDYYGVFPLRGKPLNVRDAQHSAIMKNEEIKNVINIMGLKPGTVYDETNIKTLRYGRLMIMADQDQDGSHIKGLVINFIHHFWPSLLDIPGFLKQFITPIVKVTKGSRSKSFFTIPQYNTFSESPEAKGWTCKYYKGLGTSTAEEAKDYFANLDKHEIEFRAISNDVHAPSEDGEGDDNMMPDIPYSGGDLIDMAFKKDRVEDRKKWLNGLKDDTFLDYAAAQDEGVDYSEFINKELILFSRSDNMRSIPHFVDGFKPSQRKVLFACFKKNLKKDMKVAQLAGYVGEKSQYHHGEASLHGTITNMAQNYCGSNNINLLTPSGQFGTRRMGGKDAASPRYIFTRLEPITRAIFHPDDDDILNYLSEEGMSIEPEFYMPVIPLALVNGSDGIGTGWSSTVPNFCPRDLIKCLRNMINGREVDVLHPKYHGFTGPIVQKDAKSYNVEGKIERVDEKTLLLTELPIRKWTQDYKVFLEKMLTGEPGDGKKKQKQEPELKDFRENHTDTTVSFTIVADPAKIDAWEKAKGGLENKFKLTTSISTNNMNLFNTENMIVKYESANDILSSFFEIRLEYYNKRKALLVERLGREKRILSNKARFVEEVCSGDLVVSNRKRVVLLKDLQDRGFELFPKDTKKVSNGDNEEDEEDESEDDTASDAELAKGYEYLLGLKIWSLTKEKADKLRLELAEKTKQLEELEATEPTQIWLKDLDAVEVALDDRDAAMEASVNKETKARKAANKRGGKKKAPARKNAPTKKKVAKDYDSDDDEGFSDSDDDFEMVVQKPKPRKPPAAKAPVAKKAAAPTATTKVVKKPVVAKKAAPLPKDEDSDSDSDLEVGLLDRIKTGLLVSPRGEKRKESPVNSVKNLTSDSESEDEAPVKKAKKVPAKKAATKKPAAKKPAAKKPAAKKALVLLDDSDDEVEGDFDAEDSDSDESSPPTPPPRARSGRAGTKKAITYDIDSDSDEEFDFDEE